MLEQLDAKSPDLVFGILHAWVTAAAVAAPLPDGALARADQEPRLNQQWPLGRAKPGVRVGFQILAHHLPAKETRTDG
ncbi:hypothetical protein NE857_21485 [Nocardiopsis exhalans]|uniref:Uncharacterized protein n=1 Tax=Nocardiopsis exhalans TaxID=163604 RepID=A0ABY5D395_9ACTN|nr:hypothetical protein [Nocardiopsis exhalans]USY17890.1 hypothetical protein NE857_21485 [Nocardiopsis exhalans]